MCEDKNFLDEDGKTFFDLNDEYLEEEDNITIDFASKTINIDFNKLCKHSKVIRDDYKKSDIKERLIKDLNNLKEEYNIAEESFITFLQILNEEKISKDFIYNDVCELSSIYDVKSLNIKLSIFFQKYINDIDFIINQIKNTNYNDKRPDYIEKMEELLQKNINKCFETQNFGGLPITKLYNIINSSDPKSISSNDLFNFISQSYEDRQILFRFIRLSQLSDAKFDELFQFYEKAENTNKNINFNFSPENLKYIKALKDENKKLIMEKEDKNQLQKEIEQLNNDKNNIQIQLNGTLEKKNELENQISNLMNEKNQYIHQIDEIKKIKDELQRINDQLTNDKNQYINQIDDLNKEKNQFQIKIQNIENEKIQQQNEMNKIKEEFQKEINILREDKSQLQNQVTQLNNLKEEKIQLQDMINKIINEKTQLQTQNNEKTVINSELQTKIDNMNNNNNELQKTLKESKEKIDQFQTQINNLNYDKNELQKTNYQLEKRINELILNNQNNSNYIINQSTNSNSESKFNLQMIKDYISEYSSNLNENQSGIYYIFHKTILHRLCELEKTDFVKYIISLNTIDINAKMVLI